MLPRLATNVQKNQTLTMQLRGINYSDMLQEGDMVDSLNISSRRYPYITTRKKRTVHGDYSNATALASWEKLIVVDGTNLYYDDELLGTVTEGEKQFAMVNTKLVVMPDKKYYDFNDSTWNDMSYSLTNVNVTYTSETSFVVNSVDFGNHLVSGDRIRITGSQEEQNNGEYEIRSTDESLITFVSADFIWTETSGTAIQTLTENINIERLGDVPDFDYICECENRLWGCSSANKTIYASALGLPDRFEHFANLSTDSYAVAVGSAGDFTGICKLGSSVLIWKEECLHKILGSYPAQYTMYTYEIEGIPKGSAKSMQVINDCLYYLGLHGVYVYNGSYPSLISQNFGERQFVNGVGGNDGDSYLLSCEDTEGNPYLFTFELKYGIWIKEDNIKVSNFARIGRKVYFLIDGKIYLAYDTMDDPDMEWMIQFAPMYETIEGKKSYSKIVLRVEIPEGSYLLFHMKQDDGKWREMGRIVGSKINTKTLYLPRMRCDKFEIKMTGKGAMTILGMMRDFILGSEVR